MRNLQKILALALALIMSFSLVVTANAAFSDEADISEAYTESVDVLSTLEVFKGYTDGTYQPQKSITRAEVAAIIYRIATGDVADEQVAIYSDWNRFTDVHAGEWWAGYINYCANAEYIKGYGNGKFGPDDPVTGYEALAMILRAVGYGKMEGEFQGSDWAVQTAARANGLKVTRNVQNTALLNSAATRELVAELLCKAILVPTVEYNQYNGYTENDESLAKKNFGLEKIEGVVMANEYADLEDDDETLADGKTRLQVGDRAVTLNVTSTLDDIGETRYAYVKPTRNNDYDMVCSALFEEEGMNVVGETGAETKTKDLIKDTGLKDNGEKTLHYRNFDLANADYTSDWRLEFEVYFWPTETKTAAQVRADFLKDYADSYAIWDKESTPAGSDYLGYVGMTLIETEAVDWDCVADDKPHEGYTMVIKANDEITEQQLGVIRGIFAMADDDTHSLGVTGSVYAGSKSTDNNKGGGTNTNRWNDLSDEISYRTFYNDYISSKLTKIEGTTNGNTLKVIDNNNDGYVDYVLYTHYVLDEVVDSTTKDSKTTFYWDRLDTDEYEPAYIGEYEPTVGDIVIYAEIDGKAQMKLADSENATINAISYKDVTATSTDGKTYEQSDITNGTDMDQLITAMDEKVEYVLYLDNYGYVRAYKLANGNQYGLVTELYPTHSYNSAYVKDVDLTVELMTADDNYPKEHDVINSKDNAFDVGSETRTWTVPDRYEKPNYLERAQAHLNLDKDELFDFKPEVTETGSEDVWQKYSFTNVAKYNMTEDGDVNIYSAAEYAYNQDGQRLYYSNGDPVYAVDYIQLEITEKIEKGAWKFPIDEAYRDYGHTNGYVNAVNDTEFYLVMEDTIKHIVGRANLPELKAEENNIRAMYAVAENTTADREGEDYWVANVIVIELEDLTTKYDSVSLGYFNFQKHSDQVKYLNTLNNEYAGYRLDVIPEGKDWQGQWREFGFWGLRGTEKTDEADTVEASLKRIGTPSGTAIAGQAVLGDEDYISYNDNGIYVGVVERIEKLDRRGGYIVATKAVWDPDANGGEGGFAIGDKIADAVKLEVDNSQIFAINEKKSATEALDINIIKGGEAAESDVEKNDIIIWVNANDSKTKTAFVVDLTDKTVDPDRSWTTPSWLVDQAIYIALEQGYDGGSDTPSEESHTVTWNVSGGSVGVDVTVNSKTFEKGDKVSGTSFSFTAKAAEKSGYEVKTVGGSGATVMFDATSGEGYVTNITDDVSLIITVGKAKLTLDVSLAKDTSATLTANAHSATGTSFGTVTGGSTYTGYAEATGVAVGDSVYVSVTTSASGQFPVATIKTASGETVAYTLGNYGDADDKTWDILFTMPGENVTVVVDQSNTKYSVKLSDDTTGVAFKGSTPSDINPGGTLNNFGTTGVVTLKPSASADAAKYVKVNSITMGGKDAMSLFTIEKYSGETVISAKDTTKAVTGTIEIDAEVETATREITVLFNFSTGTTPVATPGTPVGVTQVGSEETVAGTGVKYTYSGLEGADVEIPLTLASAADAEWITVSGGTYDPDTGKLTATVSNGLAIVVDKEASTRDITIKVDGTNSTQTTITKVESSNGDVLTAGANNVYTVPKGYKVRISGTVVDNAFKSNAPTKIGIAIGDVADTKQNATFIEVDASTGEYSFVYEISAVSSSTAASYTFKDATVS